MHTTSSTRTRRATALTAVITAVGLAFPMAAAAESPAPASAAPADVAAPAPLTNLAHLDFLLDEATPPEDVPGHGTYRIEEEPTLVLPWTYADSRAGGAFERVGGGTLDPATGYWEQGAYNADDISRAAVVYLRHWQQTGTASSRESAYELLRSLAYLQTLDGPGAGNVVLWMQPDGTLNPSGIPAELPDPSDSGPSYWLARTIWAFGEGYAAFRDDDPAFAAFLEERLLLAVDAVDRQVLTRYGEWTEADGARVPAWLIVDGADASAEAVLGLAARVAARPDDDRSAEALRKLAEGIAAMSAGDERRWPYGAVLPWAQSRSMWHGWGAQMPAALAVASEVLADTRLLDPAVRDAAVFTPTLLTAGGPDNGWFPAPTERVQIAYGADARVQSLLAVQTATGSAGFGELAAMQAAWFFGANRAGEAMYDPATGATYDGIAADGTINANSGAESTIHGLLTMLALDARPAVAARAVSVTTIAERDGLVLVEAEAAGRTDGERTAPVAWTGESLWSGGGLALDAGEYAVFPVGEAATDRWVEPVVWSSPGTPSTSRWSAGNRPMGTLSEDAPAQGVSPVPGVLLPQLLPRLLPSNRSEVRVDVASGSLELDALLVRPFVATLVLTGDGRTELAHCAGDRPQPTRMGEAGATSVVRVYGADGAALFEREIRGERTIVLPPGAFAIAQS